jgi:hypothetical protein
MRTAPKRPHYGGGEVEAWRKPARWHPFYGSLSAPSQRHTIVILNVRVIKVGGNAALDCCIFFDRESDRSARLGQPRVPISRTLSVANRNAHRGNVAVFDQPFSLELLPENLIF